MQPLIEQFFLCDCSNEALLCSRFNDDRFTEIFLAIYTYGQYQKKPNIFRRLKYCWYHLTTGKKYEDQMILSQAKAKELGEWLIENSK